ncbi:MAG: FAD-dependent oxidoreductase [Planctomycetota bacterium]
MNDTPSQDPVAFPHLSDEQIEQLARLAECADFADGERLFEQGTRDYPFFVVKLGEVEIEEHSSGGPRHVTFHGPGQFTGDVDLLTGRTSLVSATARGPVQAYRVEAHRLRAVLNELPTLSELLLEAFQARRLLLERSQLIGLRVIGGSHCAEANLLREFLYKNKVPHTFLDIDLDIDAAWLSQHGLSRDSLPAVICNESVAIQPSLSTLAEHIGIRRQLGDAIYDLIVIGAGPAGLAAAVYGASEGLRTVVLDRIGPGGQAGASSKIENYMGFPSGLTGTELANKGYLQALKFGAQFSAPAQVTDITPRPGGGLQVALGDGAALAGEAVLIATGASYRQLAAKGCDRFFNAGVFSAATSVEARQCCNARAVVIGGGNSAGQAALFLAEHAEHVVLLLRSGDLRKSMSEYLVHRIEVDRRIDVWLHSELEQVDGSRLIERALIRNNRSGDLQELDCAAVFSFIGARPHTEWVPSAIARDERGFLLTGPDIADSGAEWTLDREPCQLETSQPGVFAAGDVRHGSTKRVAFAVGDGALAVTCVHQVRGRS